MTLALVVAVLLKYFAIEAYKIPTGSMQPTLMGWSDGRGGGLFDRVLVDKLSFHARDPERFEVVVFQFPLDRSKHFVKRLVGMPGDHLRIAGGDLWLEVPGENGELEWRIVRRPQGVQESHWFEVKTKDRWNLGSQPDRWTTVGTGLHASDEANAIFPGDEPSVRDNAEHGYSQSILNAMGRPKRAGGQNDVGDLRLAATLRADDGCREIRLELKEGSQTCSAVLPGPAASEGARIEIRSSTGPRATLDQPTRLGSGAPARVRFWNLDDRVELEWNGEVILQMDIAPARRGDTGVALATFGGGARFDDLVFERDIFYDADSGPVHSWRVPEDHYVVLGDNSVDSADSRAWQRTTVHSMEGEFEGSISGQRRPDKNPANLIESEHHDDVAFRDEWGERRVFRSTRVHASNRSAPFVPRHLMRGRAVCVFWPWNPIKGISRPSWVR